MITCCCFSILFNQQIFPYHRSGQVLSSFFSGALQLHCKFCYCHKMLSVVSLSVMRVYCDKTAEVRIMQFSLKCSPMPELFAYQVWWRNLRGFPRSGVQTRVRWFSTSQCYVRNCKIELRWQLITNRKSYVGFWLQQKSMTLTDLERQYCVSVMHTETKQLRLELRQFHTSAIRILRLKTKFKGLLFEFQA